MILIFSKGHNSRKEDNPTNAEGIANSVDPDQTAPLGQMLCHTDS